MIYLFVLDHFSSFFLVSYYLFYFQFIHCSQSDLFRTHIWPSCSVAKDPAYLPHALRIKFKILKVNYKSWHYLTSAYLLSFVRPYSLPSWNIMSHYPVLHLIPWSGDGPSCLRDLTHVHVMPSFISPFIFSPFYSPSFKSQLKCHFPSNSICQSKLDLCSFGFSEKKTPRWD